MNDVSFGSKVWGTDGTPEASTESPMASLQDVADFRQYLEDGPSAAKVGASSGTSPGTTFGTSSMVGHLLGNVQETMHEGERKFQQSLKRVTRTGDPVAGLQLQENLSQLAIDHAIATKVISKTTQGLESLMKLQ